MREKGLQLDKSTVVGKITELKRVYIHIKIKQKVFSVERYRHRSYILRPPGPPEEDITKYYVRLWESQTECHS